jgi:RNA polymerase sigma factor (sigma-70 family)
MAPLLAQGVRRDRAFERLYRRHVKDVYRYAYAVLQNRADAEDVTQTTFLNAYRAFERGERPDKPHNWLIAIAHNVCRQRFRQSQRRPNEVEFNDDAGAQLVEDDNTPTAEDIRRALSFLPFNQRAALVMRELEGRSYAEIAAVLELSVSAIETLIFRARRSLREQLEGSLTCREAELAISQQLDGRLSRADKGLLRAHLRECPECATFARSQRAQRSALKALGSVPLPISLASFFGGGGGTVGATAVATKAAVVVAAAALAGSASYETVRHVKHPAKQRAVATQSAEATRMDKSAGATPLAPVVAAQHVARTQPVSSERSEHSQGRGESGGRSGQSGRSVEDAQGENNSTGSFAADDNNGRGNSGSNGRGNGRSNDEALLGRPPVAVAPPLAGNRDKAKGRGRHGAKQKQKKKPGAKQQGSSGADGTQSGDNGGTGSGKQSQKPDEPKQPDADGSSGSGGSTQGGKGQDEPPSASDGSKGRLRLASFSA